VSHIDKAYRFTPSGSKFRLLMGHFCVFVVLTFGDDHSNSAWSNDKLRAGFKENNDLWSDVVSLMRIQPGKIQVDPRKRPACDYHQHPGTEACPYAKKKMRVRLVMLSFLQGKTGGV
jgi:hypothetical protein